MDRTQLPELLTVSEVAVLLRLRPSTIYQAASEGRIACVYVLKAKKKRVVRFRLPDIEALIACDSTLRPLADKTGGVSK